MTIKDKFSSFKRKIKSVFQRKNEEPPFYLPDEEGDVPPFQEEAFDRTSEHKKFKAEGKGKENIIGFLPSFFTPEKRPAVHKIFIFSILFAFCYFSAKTASIFLTPKNLKTLSKSSSSNQGSFYNSQQWSRMTAYLNTNDLFKTVVKKEDNSKKEEPKVDRDKKCYEADKATGLPLNLVGTSVLQDRVKSLASVQVRGKTTFDYLREGDQVDSLAKIFKIERLKLILKNLKSGECEFLANKEFEKEQKEYKKPVILSPREFKESGGDLTQGKGIKQSGNKICISRKVLDDKLKNVSKILQDAKALPITNSDGTLSFKVVEIQPGSIYSHLNIQDQDIIKSINGKPIKNYNDVMGLFGKIRSVSKLSLGLNRGGADVPMSYEITKGDPKNCL